MADPTLDATALAELVRNGEVSPLELVEAAISRIEALDPALNAVIHPLFDSARERARSGDLPSGPFTGVPFLTKDLEAATAGDPHHMGCAALKEIDYRSPHTDEVAAAFARAGLVNLGRTNCPELGSTITTEPEAYGPTRNPWNTAYSTGGSSGGSAAAVASGMVPMAHANDGGGSIRIPASECGLVGLKPTRGRVSHGPMVGEGWAGMAIDGVVTRTVRDTAAALDAISGPAVGDPYWAPPPARPFAAEVGADPGSLRIGLAPELQSMAVHPECQAAVLATGRLLEELGHHVEVAQPTALDEPGWNDTFVTVVAVGTAHSVDQIEEILGRKAGPGDLERMNLRLAEIGRGISGPEYMAAVDAIHAYGRRMASWWHPADDSPGFDVLVTPTLAGPPPPIGWLMDPAEGGRRLGELMGFTAQFNMTGQPAVSLPLHRTPEGLPVGVQFVGPYAGEAGLIRLAAQIEAANPWAQDLPPIFAD